MVFLYHNTLCLSQVTYNMLFWIRKTLHYRLYDKNSRLRTLYKNEKKIFLYLIFQIGALLLSTMKANYI